MHWLLVQECQGRFTSPGHRGLPPAPLAAAVATASVRATAAGNLRAAATPPSRHLWALPSTLLGAVCGWLSRVDALTVGHTCRAGGKALTHTAAWPHLQVCVRRLVPLAWHARRWFPAVSYTHLTLPTKA